jgi:hypothetical protein
MRNLILALTAAVLFGMIAMPQARASELDKKTFVTFHQPMEIPGMILPSGDYVIKRADTALPDVVRFTNRTENHVYATVFAMPTYRPVPTSDVVIITEERAANAPEAIKKWFYPGDTIGAEFIYPKSRETLMAMNTTSFSEPSSPAPAPAMTQTPAPVPNEAESQAEPTPAPEPEVAQSTMPQTPAQNSTASSQPAQPQEPAATQQDLPKTASNLSLFALLGLLCAGVGVGFRSLSGYLS